MTASPTDQTVLPNCPRCTGKLQRIHDGRDQYVSCMNCGRTIKDGDFELPTQTAELSNPQTEHDEDNAPHPDTHNPNTALETIRWQNKPRCTHCLSPRNNIIPGTKDGTRICDSCDHTFNVRTKTVMEKSTTPTEIWLNALQLYADPERPFSPQALHGEQHTDWQAEEVHRLISEAHQRGARTIAEIIAIPRTEEPIQARFTPSNPLRLPEPRDPTPTSAPENNHMTTPNSTAEQAEASETPAPKRRPRPIERSGPEQEAHQRLTDLRWPNGVKCPKCTSIDIGNAPPSASSELRCRKCGQIFSARHNTFAYRMSVSNVDLETILNACSGKPPKNKLLRDTDITTTIKRKVVNRLQEAIVLWNQRHNQERNALTPLEYMSVNMFWAIGEEPDMLTTSEAPENSKEPETKLPDTAETQSPVAEETQEHSTTETRESNAAAVSEPETETALQPDPGNEQGEETETAEPATQQHESEAAQETSTEPDKPADPDVPQTMQEMRERMDKMEKMISSLATIIVSRTTANCPACASANTSPSETLEGFTTCNECQCHFPNKLASAMELKIPRHDPNTPKVGSSGTSVTQSPLINITIHSQQ